MDYCIGSKSGKSLCVFARYLAISIVGNLLVNAQGQVAPPAQSVTPAFEVVSLKVNKPGQSRELSIQYLMRNDKTRAMLQTLLRDRFKLRVHHETTEMPVYGTNCSATSWTSWDLRSSRRKLPWIWSS